MTTRGVGITLMAVGVAQLAAAALILYVGAPVVAAVFFYGAVLCLASGFIAWRNSRPGWQFGHLDAVDGRPSDS